MTVHELLQKLLKCDLDAVITVAYPHPDPALRYTDYSVAFAKMDWFDVQGSGKQIIIGAVGRPDHPNKCSVMTHACEECGGTGEVLDSPSRGQGTYLEPCPNGCKKP